jgi:hypothetical protein
MAKYQFTTQPPAGEYGTWKTTDGFKCYTNDRKIAVRWYVRWLKKNKSIKN